MGMYTIHRDQIQQCRNMKSSNFLALRLSILHTVWYLAFALGMSVPTKAFFFNPAPLEPYC